MNRRDFLKVTSSATLGGMFLPISENPFPTEDVIPDTHPTSAFQLFTNPASDLEVISPAGIRTGIVLGSQLDAISQMESLQEVEETLSENEAIERLSFPQLIKDIPPQLLPLLVHPINHIQSFEDGYTLDAIISPPINSDGEDFSPEFVPIVFREDLVTPNAGANFWVGDYFVRVSAENGHVGGCISRVAPHAGLLVRYVPGGTGGTQIFNLHIASWWQGSTPCVGAYESASGWCQNSCTWNIWNMLYTLIYAAAIVHVAHWVAAGIAASGATASLGILVAAPGVPPPP